MEQIFEDGGNQEVAFKKSAQSASSADQKKATCPSQLGFILLRGFVPSCEFLVRKRKGGSDGREQGKASPSNDSRRSGNIEVRPGALEADFFEKRGHFSHRVKRE